MLNLGREGFVYSWNEKNRPVPLFVMLTVVAAIIPEEGLAPSLYRTKIEREQFEMGKPIMNLEKVYYLCGEHPARYSKPPSIFYLTNKS